MDKPLPNLHPTTLSKKQLCEMYGVSATTLKEWFTRAKLEYNTNLKLFTPLEVTAIFKALGSPKYNELGQEVGVG